MLDLYNEGGVWCVLACLDLAVILIELGTGDFAAEVEVVSEAFYCLRS